ncbi:hypothetical protein P9112_003851 [Eukaryota sp. TZLM1-RC]
MADISRKDISDFTHSPNMKQGTHHHVRKIDEETDPNPTSPFKKKVYEREDKVDPFAKVVTKGTGADLNFISPSKINKRVTRTEPAPFSLSKEVLSTGVTETDPAPFPFPKTASKVKETDEIRIFNTSTLLGAYDEFHAQLDDKGKMTLVMDSTNC